MNATFRQIQIPAAEIRPARAGDAAALQAFVDGMGSASRRWRFHGGVARCSERLAETLVGGRGAPARIWAAFEGEWMVGEARFVADAGDPAQAELALSVADAWQGRGLASALLETVLAAACRAGVRRVVAEVMDDNLRMQRFLLRHGFHQQVRWNDDDGAVFELELAAAPRGSLVRRLAARVAERMAG